MQSTPIRERPWAKPAVALAAILVLSIGGLAMMGSQVSGVLSTRNSFWKGRRSVCAQAGEPPALDSSWIR